MTIQTELRRLAVADSLGEHYRRIVLMAADRINELEATQRCYLETIEKLECEVERLKAAQQEEVSDGN